MLVLTRRRGEGVAIGPDIRVTVLGMKGGQVRLGIEAPKTVEVHRVNIKAKLKLATSPELIHFAVRWVETQAGA